MGGSLASLLLDSITPVAGDTIVFDYAQFVSPNPVLTMHPSFKDYDISGVVIDATVGLPVGSNPMSLVMPVTGPNANNRYLRLQNNTELKGLSFGNSSGNGLVIVGNNNVIDSCSFFNNNNQGVYILGTASNTVIKKQCNF